jgi:hypothetical protein
MRLGVVVTQLTGRVAQPDRLREGYKAGSEFEVVIEPIGRGEAWRWLKDDELSAN